MSEAGVGPVSTRVLFDRDTLAEAFAGYEVVDQAGGDAQTMSMFMTARPPSRRRR